MRARRRLHARSSSRGCSTRNTRSSSRPDNRDVHDDSKQTTLPIARDAVAAYVTTDRKLPWFIDLLNINLGVHDRDEAARRIRALSEAFAQRGPPTTENVDFA